VRAQKIHSKPASQEVRNAPFLRYLLINMAKNTNYYTFHRKFCDSVAKFCFLSGQIDGFRRMLNRRVLLKLSKLHQQFKNARW